MGMGRALNWRRTETYVKDTRATDGRMVAGMPILLGDGAKAIWEAATDGTRKFI